MTPFETAVIVGLIVVGCLAGLCLSRLNQIHDMVYDLVHPDDETDEDGDGGYLSGAATRARVQADQERMRSALAARDGGSTQE